MRTTITKKLMGLALGAFSLTASAQCPTVTSVNLTASTFSPGLVNVVANLSGAVDPNNTTYFAYSGSNNQSFGNSNSGYLYFSNNGTHTVCVQYIDSTNNCYGSNCAVITITNATNSGTTNLCPTSSTVNVLSNSNGVLSLSQSFNTPFNNPNQVQNDYNLKAVNIGQYFFTQSIGESAIATFSNIPTNTYWLSYFHSDSQQGCSLHDSIQLIITNSLTPICPVMNSLNTSYGANGQVNITANYSGTLSNTGTFYSFENGSAGFGNSNMGSITYANNGWYSPCVYYIDSINNCWASACATVNITNATNTSSATCFANADFFLFADSTNTGNYFAYNNSTGSGSLSYLWNFGDGTSSTQAYPFHQYASAGIYTICLTVTNTDSIGSCTDTYCMMGGFKISSSALMSSFQVKAPVTTGINENNNIITSLNAYPNPIADELNIEVALTNHSTALVYTIVDALGKVVAQNKIMDAKTTINTAPLEKGFYFLSISTEKGQVLKSTKLVK